MAKPTRYATPICLLLSLLALIGIGLGIYLHSPIAIISLLLPAVIYEVYRTEGPSTTWASWLLLILIIAEIICVAFKINFNLANYLDQERTYVGMNSIPLGDIKIVFPAVMAALSIVLFIRTNGVYTKWLAVIIFVSTIATVYTINPSTFSELIKSVVGSIL